MLEPILVTLDEMKSYLRLEPDDIEEDADINSFILAAEDYVKRATGFKFEDEQPDTAKLIVKLLTSHWYDHRSIVSSSHVAVNKVDFTVRALLAQLTYTHVEEEEE
ncbi:head-tail connector protein [Halobacillus sp. Marseille-P3879]|uniref:head-tail connector protein n=1 Tax=Halobacillus sp. Marseille-P3879 TaxID=2045014 RepID=UPI000C7D25D9|nr:head-tail connector protein [Halobacillus sp. Marseille-P3879]